MNLDQIQSALAGVPLGGIRWYEKIGSTNDEAARWAAEGAPDLALVIAAEQTAGRGRSGRTWLSPAGSSLSFSLVLRLDHLASQYASRLTALGALAVANSLQKEYHLPAVIKWPNDILIDQKKVCGILAEASWHGDNLEAVILGIGINVAPNPSMTAAIAQSAFSFPVTSLEEQLHQPIDSLDLLCSILKELNLWLPQLASQAFLHAWEANLAFLGEWVQVNWTLPNQQSTMNSFPNNPQEGLLLGLNSDGSLRLLNTSSELIHIKAGEVHLRRREIAQPC